MRQLVDACRLLSTSACTDTRRPGRSVVGLVAKIAAAMGVLLILPSVQASAAGGPKVFHETWQNKWHCHTFHASGSASTECFELSGGKFTMSFVIPGSAGTGGTLPASFLPADLDPSTNFDITLGGYSFQDTIGDFNLVGKTGKTATYPATLGVSAIEKCVYKKHHSSYNSHCTPYEVEKISLKLVTVKKEPALKVVISGRTGEVPGLVSGSSSPVPPIDAKNYAGSATSDISTSLALQLDLGDWSYNASGADQVNVTGSVHTKQLKVKGSTTGASNSKVNLKGKFPQPLQ
jgi:hypothetical protein